MTYTHDKPEGQVGETPTPEDFVPVGPETALALRQQPSQFHISLICGDVSNERALPYLKRCAEQASMEAAAMVDRELMEAIYVMLRVRG